jgi:hypothetical protein
MFCSYEASEASPTKNVPDIETLKPVPVGTDPLPEERAIDVGPMDIGVAADAGRYLRRSCAHRVNRAGSNRAMTLVA